MKIKNRRNLSLEKQKIYETLKDKLLASKVEIGSKVIIIAMSIPIITSLLELVIEILP